MGGYAAPAISPASRTSLPFRAGTPQASMSRRSPSSASRSMGEGGKTDTPPIVADTQAYERWLRKRVDSESDLAYKHQQMRDSVFAFLRATFYRLGVAVGGNLSGRRQGAVRLAP